MYNNLFKNYVLSAYYLPGTLLGTKQRRQKFLTSLSLISSMLLLKIFYVCREKKEGNQEERAAACGSHQGDPPLSQPPEEKA